MIRGALSGALLNPSVAYHVKVGDVQAVVFKQLTIFRSTPSRILSVGV